MAKIFYCFESSAVVGTFFDDKNKIFDCLIGYDIRLDDPLLIEMVIPLPDDICLPDPAATVETLEDRIKYSKFYKDNYYICYMVWEYRHKIGNSPPSAMTWCASQPGAPITGSMDYEAAYSYLQKYCQPLPTANNSQGVVKIDIIQDDQNCLDIALDEFHSQFEETSYKALVWATFIISGMFKITVIPSINTHTACKIQYKI